MEKDDRTLPLRVALLITGFFMQTLNDTEKDQLDEWVEENDENMKMFEVCVEMAQRPIRPEPGLDEETDLRNRVDLIMKHLNKTITEEEKQILDDWLELSGHNKTIFNEMPQTDDMELVYYWLLRKWNENQDKMKLN